MLKQLPGTRPVNASASNSLMIEKPMILFVDDQWNALIGLRRAFRNSFNLKAVNCPLEALEFLEDAENVAVIVSDLLMPKMDGFSFLQKARKRHPHASLIIFTGNPTLQNSLGAMSDLNLEHYVTKPCSKSKLFEILNSALAAYEQRCDRERDLPLDPLKSKLEVHTAALRKSRNLLQSIQTCTDSISSSAGNLVFLKETRSACEELDDTISKLAKCSMLSNLPHLPSSNYFSVKVLFEECCQFLLGQDPQCDKTMEYISLNNSQIFCGNYEMLKSASQLLISSALKYCSTNDAVLLSIIAEDTKFRIRVTDTCTIYSSDNQNSQHSLLLNKMKLRRLEDVTLDLSIVREIARLHGQSRIIQTNNPNSDSGVVFEIEIPQLSQGLSCNSPRQHNAHTHTHLQSIQ